MVGEEVGGVQKLRNSGTIELAITNPKDCGHAAQRSNTLVRRNSIAKIVRARIKDHISDAGDPKDVAIETSRQNWSQR